MNALMIVALVCFGISWVLLATSLIHLVRVVYALRKAVRAQRPAREGDRWFLCPTRKADSLELRRI